MTSCKVFMTEVLIFKCFNVLKLKHFKILALSIGWIFWMAIFLKKNDTSIWNVYLSDSRKKRTIQNNPARFLLFLLDATRHVRFSTIIFRLPIFLFVHEQEDSCTLPLATHKYCQVLFIFFFPRRLCRNSYCTFPDFQNRFV